MKVEIFATYDEEKRILRVKNEHGVEWKIGTEFPSVYLSSLIGSSFGIAVMTIMDFSSHLQHKFKLTIEEL